MVFEGATEVKSEWNYLSLQFHLSRNEREMCEFEMDRKNFLFAL